MTIEVDCVWPLGALLGEGPLWAEDEGALWFTDIEGRALHRYHPATAARASWTLPVRPGFVVRGTQGEMIVGAERQLWRFADGTLEPLAEVDSHANTRLNDAAVDRTGRLWFGSLDLALTDPTGHVHLWRGHDGQAVRRVGGRAPITNGPALSPDGRLLYHVDTVAGAIWRFDVSASDELVDGELFVAIDESDGRPDGAVCDSEGCVWVALWGGWRVRRYDPAGVRMLDVPVPAEQPTKVAFGGPDLRTAYVTSATIGLDAVARAEQPLAGGLFAFESPVAGLPAGRVRL
jgi:sugar lactone lactonase YvrE